MFMCACTVCGALKGGPVLRVKYERLARGWSQVAIAFYARMAIGDVGKIENGRLQPTDGQLDKLATALGIDRDELLKKVEHPAVPSRTTTPQHDGAPASLPLAAARR